MNPTYKDARYLKLRERLIEQRQRRCQKCRKSEVEVQLTIHHGYYTFNTPAWQYEEDTLWVLCWPCHEEAQNILVTIHKTLARTFPFALKEFSHTIEGHLHVAIYGISLGEWQAILEEERAQLSRQFSDYSLSILSSSDLGPSRADEMEAGATKVFPGIEVVVDELKNTRDCSYSVAGPDSEICAIIEKWSDKWAA